MMVHSNHSVTPNPWPPPASLLRRLSPGIPYLAVALGLYLLHSAWLSIGLYHLGIIAVLLRERQWDTLRALARGFHPWLLLAAIMLGLVGGAVTFACWPLLGLPHFAARLAQVGLTTHAFPCFLLYFSLVNPLLEETFWRGYHADFSPRPVWNDLWFAGYHFPVLAVFMHWYWLPPVLFGLAAIAWVWRWLAHRPGGLLTNYISHMAADVGIMAAVLMVLG